MKVKTNTPPSRFALWATLICAYIIPSSGFMNPAFLNTNRKISITRRFTSSSSDQQPLDNETRETISEKLEDEVQILMAENEEEEDTVEKAARCHLEVFNTRLETIHLDRTMIGPSIVVPNQRGLFSSCDCKEGDLLTCYPGDLVIVIPDDEDDEDYDDEEDNEYTILIGDHVPNKEMYDDPEYDISDELMGYLLHASEDHAVLGLPELDDNPSYFGHFANDGAIKPTKAKDVDSYVTESLAKANVKHDRIGSHMVTVATKDIAKGTEILVSYGPEYWMDRSDFE